MNNPQMTEVLHQAQTIEEGDTFKQTLGDLQSQQTQTLRHSVKRSLADYFSHLDGQPVSNLYTMVLAEMEIPLLEKVLEYTRGNQTKAAEVLGLNRGTLRKKLKQYDLL